MTAAVSAMAALVIAYITHSPVLYRCPIRMPITSDIACQNQSAAAVPTEDIAGKQRFAFGVERNVSVLYV